MSNNEQIRVGVRVILINTGNQDCYKVGDKGTVIEISKSKNNYGCGIDYAIFVKYDNGKKRWCTKNMLAPLFCKAII